MTKSIRDTEQQLQFDAAYAAGLELATWQVSTEGGEAIEVLAVSGHGAVLVARELLPDVDWEEVAYVAKKMTRQDVSMRIVFTGWDR